MTASFQIRLDGSPADDALYTALVSLDVEENADSPDALLLRLPVVRSAMGDLRYVGDGTFEPYTNIAVVATAADDAPQCIFDGFVLGWKLHVDRAAVSSTIEVWGHDASWLMNVEEKVKEWAGVTDGLIANTIFGEYGFEPDTANTDDDSPAHTADEHTLLQRSTDLQLLRSLARRSGRICRVACTDTPGRRIGSFVPPSVDGDPVLTLSLADPEAWSVDALDIDWDVMRPTQVQARQLSVTGGSDDGEVADSTDSGLAALDDRDLAAYAGRPSTLLLTSAADPGALPSRASAALREAGWFVRAEGEADVSRLRGILRVGTVVAVEGVGSLHSGNWFVWSVRHMLTADSHAMRFTLVRNAVGPSPSGGGLLGSLSAALGGGL